jgi:uncharacterized protein (TIGR00369 family)
MPISQQDICNAMLQQLSGAFASIPFNQILGLHLDHLSNDFAVMSFDMKKELIGNYLHGILHGGVISSVLDMAGGMVVMATAIHKHPECSIEELAEIVGNCSTVDLHVSFLKPGKGEHFTAKAYLTKTGSHISFTRMELFSHDETLIATASGTYLLK